MTRQEAQLGQAFAGSDLIVVCWEPGCSMHRLPTWDSDRWVPRDRHVGYRHYSHGICSRHYRLLMQQVRHTNLERAQPAAVPSAARG